MLRWIAFVLVAMFLQPALHAESNYSWTNVPIGGGGYVTGVEFHPTQPGLLYARTDVGGAYRWDEQNATWIALNDDIGRLNQDDRGVLSIALDPTDPDKAYLLAGLYHQDWAPNGALLSSDDRGETWARAELPFKVGGNEDGRGTGERLVVDPNRPNRLIVGTARSGLWISEDSGATWERKEALPSDEVLFVHMSLSQTRAQSEIIVATTAAPASLFFSDDLGETWKAIPDQPEDLLFRRIDQNGDSVFLAAGDALGPNGISRGGVWRFNLTSAVWTDISPPEGQGGFSGISVDPNDPNRLAASTMNRWYPGNEIYLTENGGKTWKPILETATRDYAQAPYASSIAPHWITDLAIDPFNASRLSFVTGHGVYQTYDANAEEGASFKFMARGMEETVILDLISPPLGAPLYSVMGDIDGFAHHHIDQSPEQGRFKPERGSNNSIAFAADHPETLIRTIERDEEIHIAVSRDSGATWNYFQSDPFEGAHGGHAAISADAETVLWTPRDAGTFVTSDFGSTWQEVDGLPTRLRPVSDPIDSSVFYAFDMEAGTVYRSTNSGIAFSPIQTGLPSLPSWRRADGTLVAVPGQAGNFYVTTGAALFKASDQGDELHEVSGVQESYLIGFGKGLDEAEPSIYLWGMIADEIGIFRSDDGGLNWLRINDAQNQFAYPNVLIGDSRTYGRVYIGTSGRGIIVGEPLP